MSDCLPDSQLRKMIATAPGEEQPGLERHVAECPVCLARMKELLMDTSPPHDTAAHELTSPFDPATLPVDPTFPVIPGYTIKRILGQGGMGVVYEAEEHDLHPQVALKVILTGGPTNVPLNTLSSAREIDRLLTEAKLLARLNHPAVAHIYRAGTYTAGSHTLPYFSMEYIEGATLSDYLRANQLELRQIVRLLVDICEAVQHAHQKGIIHRDLKPGNVMVTTDGRPKVLDFGIAAAVGSETAGSRAGTLPYMSPEQVGPDPVRDVDTRSDVYALGLIAYKVLSGHKQKHSSFPYEVQDRPVAQIIDAILTTPPKPLRQTNRKLPRDLDSIVGKALEKDKECRYPSAQALADDLRHWLNDEPVSARRLGQVEALARTVRRNRAAVIGGTLVLLSLTGGLFMTWTWMNEALNQKGQAEFNAADALEKKGIAERAKGIAEKALIEETKAKKAEVAAKKDAERLAVQEILSRGHDAASENDLLGALPHYVRALRRIPPDEQEAHRRRIGLLLRQTPRLTQFWSHGDAVTHVEFSPDGRRVVSVSLDGTARLTASDTGKPIADLAHKAAINHAAFSHDGKWVATGSDDGTARVWESATGKPCTEPPDEKERRREPVSHVAFHPTDAARVLVVRGTRFARSESRTTPDTRIPGTTTTVPGPPIMIPGPGKRMTTIPGPPRTITTPGTIIPGTTQTRNPHGTAELIDVASGKVLDLMSVIGWLNHASFRADGKRIVASSGREDGRSMARIYEPGTGGGKGPRIWEEEALPHKAPVHCAAFSPDGLIVVTASGRAERKAGEAQLWDAETREPIGPTMEHDGVVTHVAFSPDGRRVLTASVDGTARVWDVGTSKPIITRAPLQHQDRVVGAWFSPEGRRVLTASWDGTARVWDTETGEALLPPLRHGVGLTCAAFDPDGRRIATAGRDGSVRVWDLVPLSQSLPTLRLADVVPVNRGGILHSTTFAAPRGQKPLVWNKRYQGGLLANWSLFTPDGRILTAAATPIQETIPGGARGESHDGVETTHLVLWDAVTGRMAAGPFPHRGPVADGLPSPDGRRLVTFVGSAPPRPAELVIWGLSDGSAHTRMVIKGGLQAVAFRTDDRCLAATPRMVGKSPDLSREMQVYEVTDVGPPEKDVLLPLSGPVEDAAFGPGAATLATVCVRGPGPQWETQLWDLATGKPTSIPYLSTTVTQVVVGPEANHVLGYAPGLSLVTRTARIPVPEEARTLVHLYNPKSGTAHKLRHAAPVTWAAFSGDGRHVATACLDHTARVWDVETGEPITPPLKHRARIHHVAFGPAGSGVVVTTSDDRTARLWDITTGHPLSPPLLHQDAVLASSFSADGKRLLTSCADGTGRLWDLTHDESPVEQLEAVATLLAGQRLDERRGPITLTPGEISRLPRLAAAGGAAVRSWHRDEAGGAERKQDALATVFHLDRVIATEPGPKGEFYLQRALASARLERWEAVEADYARTVEGKPPAPGPYFALALLQAYRGREEQYKSTCAAMMAAHGKGVSPTTLSWVVRASVLRPDSGLNLADLLPPEGKGKSRLDPSVHGPLLYRVGRFRECAELLKNSNFRERIFLAMALHKLGDTAKAKITLGPKPDLSRIHMMERQQELSRSPWMARLEFELVYKEAEETLK